MRAPPSPRPNGQRPNQAVFFRRRLIVFGAIPTLVVLLVYFTAFSGGSSPPGSAGHSGRGASQQTSASARLEVGLRTMAVTDPSRATYNYATGKSTPGRVLAIEVRYPTRSGSATREKVDARPAFSAKEPLVVFAPGFRLQSKDYSALLDAWVRSGMVVASLAFPDTTYPASEPPYQAGLPHGSPESDLYSQPADVAFALRQLLADEASKTSWLHRAFDTKRVGLAGHSDGAATVAALAYDSSYASRGLPIGAVAVLSGGEFSLSGQHYASTTASGAPVFVVQSAADTCAAPWQAVQLYDALSAPKYFLRLDSASHLGPYDGSDPAAPVVRSVTTDFFDKALSTAGVSNSSALLALGASPGLSSITDAAVADPIATPAGSGQCPHD